MIDYFLMKEYKIMNRKQKIILLIMFLMAILISACSNSSQKNDGEQENKTTENSASSKNEEEDLELTGLLPDKKGYIWKYDGAVEYGHEMELKSINESAEKAIYNVEGEVEDMSGGESKNDFSLNLIYTVTKDKLTQKIDSEMMMDSNFSEIDLIQLPLTEGAKWTQTQENAEGEEVTLKSTIDSIEEDGEQKIYTVTYKDSDSEYYEKREIKEGVGVIGFKNLYIDEDNEDTMPMGYEINYDSTGYLDSQKK